MRRPIPGRNCGVFPFFLYGGFHSKEDWSWQDPLFLLLFPCNLFKTLHAFGYLVISENYVKIKLLLTDTWHVLFQSFVFDFDFPLQCCIFVRFFMLFTSNVLNTLRQHIWCSPFFSNDFTKKSQRQHKGLCIFFESCAYFATNGKTVSARASPTCLIGWQLQHLAIIPRVLLGYFIFHYLLRPLISILKTWQ